MIERLIKNWRKKIPEMECEAGCRECCEGYAPGMTRWEWREIKHPGKYATGRSLTNCPFYKAVGCAIYAKRPLICRLFGTVDRLEVAGQELETTLPIFCPRGRRPEKPLALSAAMNIEVRYQKLLQEEILRTGTDWCRYLPAHQAGETLPEKFAWLRYVLSTRDGQTALAFRVVGPQILPRLPEPEFAKMAAIFEQGANL